MVAVMVFFKIQQMHFCAFYWQEDSASAVSFAYIVFYGGTPWHKMPSCHVRIFLSLSCCERGCCVSLSFCWAHDHLEYRLYFPAFLLLGVTDEVKIRLVGCESSFRVWILGNVSARILYLCCWWDLARWWERPLFRMMEQQNRRNPTGALWIRERNYCIA